MQTGKVHVWVHAGARHGRKKDRRGCVELSNHPVDHSPIPQVDQALLPEAYLMCRDLTEGAHTLQQLPALAGLCICKHTTKLQQHWWRCRSHSTSNDVILCILVQSVDSYSSIW
jgi:hypothetical protein